MGGDVSSRPARRPPTVERKGIRALWTLVHEDILQEEYYQC